MVTNITTLSENWTLSAVPTPSGDQPGSGVLTGPAALLPDNIPATVPGTVHTDLLAAGLIVDPYLDLNESELGWIGHTAWSYSTLIEWDQSAHDRTELVFDGLDTVATVSLNGAVIGRTVNQHRAYRFDVTGELRSGKNELEVRFDSAWEYAERVQTQLGDLPNAYPSPFNFIRKMASNFGWDWGPQLVTAGIWKAVRLESWSTARLAEVRPTVGLDGNTGLLTVDARLELARPGALSAGALHLVVALAGQRVTVPISGTTARASLRVQDVAVWWPRGMGDQPLYGLRVSIADSGELDAWERRIGFRTARLDTSEDGSGSAFTFVVNETPIFIRGANWIPDDCFPSSITPARYRQRIEQATEANLNLLRVWGGGIYESDAFYDICDELGVLVWQDFLFACAAYPEESPIREEVEAEARDNVVRLAPHPSLILWNGCNENIWGWFDWDWQKSLDRRTWGLGYYEELLPAIVAELSPATPYWPGSPFSGSMGFHANETSRGNVHIWDVWNSVDYTAYGDYNPRFVSEFGFQGPPTWSTIEQSIHDQPLTPDSPAMLLHQKADDGNGKLERGLAPHLPLPATMEDWHYLTQVNQSRAIVFAVERYRSQRGHCMGTIVWQLNDCWPVTSWAAIDGYGRRKPLWHGLRRANAERLLTVQPDSLRTDDAGLNLVAVNDGITPWSMVAEVSRRALDGSILASESISIVVDPLAVRTYPLTASIARPADPANEVVVVVVDGGVGVTHYFVEDKDLALIDPALVAEVGDWRDGEQTVTLTSASIARGVVLFVDRLHPEAFTDVADLDIVPGIETTVVVHSPVPLDAASLIGEPVLRSVNRLMATLEVTQLQL